jgi:uncharacterized membrane protein YfcA
MSDETHLLAIALLVVAMMYAAVGQAGASGYIAVMGVAGFGPLAMKTTALALNLVVAGIGSALFLKAGRLSWRTVWPFAVLGFPFSFLGGAVELPEEVYFPIVGFVLILSAIQMLRAAISSPARDLERVRPAPVAGGLVAGAVIGFLSGITGTGGGVFLAPVLLGMKWGTVRQTAATTAVYNLMNSVAALVGAHAAWDHIPADLPKWIVAVGVGGALGAWVGSRLLSDRILRIVLGILLLVSGGKLVW